MAFFSNLLLLVPVLTPAQSEADTMQMVQLDDVVVSSGLKEYGQLRQQPVAVSLIGRQQIEAQKVTSLKGAGHLVPNLFIPDYGSRLTSAIYIRGIGSRINTPAVGLYVDNVPYIDKSAFDFNFYDVERIDVLRGPQGTLYGRNTMGGLMRVFTRNPLYSQGTDIRLGYASGDNHRNLSLTHYHKVRDGVAFSAGGYYEGGDGFFDNDYLHHKADAMQSGGGRLRLICQPSDRWTLDGSISYDYSDEGAYPYYYTGTLAGDELYSDLVDHISNNRDSRYRRALLNAGVNLSYSADRWQMNAVTSYQYIADRMLMDQDFLSQDIYTLEQRQKIHTLNQEVTVRNTTESRWQRVSGLNVMYQSLYTEGPVRFYADGLRWLEGNINGVMPSISQIPMLQMMGFSDMSINFRGDQLAMLGTYDTPTFSLALFHQSSWRIADHLLASVGLRCEGEWMKITYHSPSDVLYGYSMPNVSNDKMSVDLQDLESHVLYDGRQSDRRFSLLPRLALTYHWDQSNVYASLSMGQRSGGYNVQLFGDLLQGALRADMMAGVRQGVGDYLDYLAANNPNMPKVIPDPENPGTMVPLPDFVRRVMADKMPKVEAPSVASVPYRPELSWNVELGTHLTRSSQHHDCRSKLLQMDAALFYSRVEDQQIARFAPSGLGRQMVNAGSSQSFGLEWSGRWMPDAHLSLGCNYGYTHSTFIRYNDGNQDYADRYVPFVPQHTMNVDAEYGFDLRQSAGRWSFQRLTLGANASGVGRIYWTESNDVSQPFYTTFGARVSLESSRLTLMLWGKNLSDRHYQSFYFESAGRGFEQHNKPLQIGVDVMLHF